MVLAEGEVGRDDDRGLLVEAADEVEQELSAGLDKGQITKFVENDEVHPRALSCLDGTRGSRADFGGALVVGAVMSSALTRRLNPAGPDVVR